MGNQGTMASRLLPEVNSGFRNVENILCAGTTMRKEDAEGPCQLLMGNTHFEYISDFFQMNYKCRLAEEATVETVLLLDDFLRTFKEMLHLSHPQVVQKVKVMI